MRTRLVSNVRKRKCAAGSGLLGFLFPAFRVGVDDRSDWLLPIVPFFDINLESCGKEPQQSESLRRRHYSHLTSGRMVTNSPSMQKGFPSRVTLEPLTSPAIKSQWSALLLTFPVSG